MGTLRSINLNEIINKYNTQIFVETGTGYGTGIIEALRFPFKHILSVEIDKDQANLCSYFFRFDGRIKIYNDSSYNFLNGILPYLPKDIPLLFFLDAHYPSADLGIKAFDSESDEDIRMPLYSELQIIKNIRMNCKDVIVVDDIYLYDDSDRIYGASNKKTRDDILPRKHRNYLNKFIDLFKDTHHYKLNTEGEGFLILEPC